MLSESVMANSPEAATAVKMRTRPWLLIGGLCTLVSAVAVGIIVRPLPVDADTTVVATVHVATTGSRSVIQAQAARLTSRDVLLAALQQEPVRGLSLVRRFPDALSAAGWLEDVLKVDVSDGSEIITLTLRSDEPEEAAVLLNAVTRSYLEAINAKEAEQQRAHRQMDRQRAQQAQAQAEVARAARKLEEKRKERDRMVQGEALSSAAAVSRKHQDLQQQLGRAQAELVKRQAELEKAQAEWSASRSAKEMPDLSAVLNTYLQRARQLDPALKAKTDLLEQLEQAVTAMRVAGHPDDEIILVLTRKQLASVQREVAGQQRRLRKEVFDSYRAKAAADQALRVARLQQKVKPLDEAVNRQADTVATLRQQTQRLGLVATRLDALAADVKEAEQGLARLQAGLHEQPPPRAAVPDFRATVSQEARWLPPTPSPRPASLLLAPPAALGAAGLVLTWLGFRRRGSRTIVAAAGPAGPVIGPSPVVLRQQLCLPPPLPARGGDLSDPVPPAHNGHHAQIAAPAEHGEERNGNGVAQTSNGHQQAIAPPLLLRELTDTRAEAARLRAQLTARQTREGETNATEARLRAAVAETVWLGREVAALRRTLADGSRGAESPSAQVSTPQERADQAVLAAELREARDSLSQLEAERADAGALEQRLAEQRGVADSLAQRLEAVLADRDQLAAQVKALQVQVAPPREPDSAALEKALEAAWADAEWPWLEAVPATEETKAQTGEAQQAAARHERARARAAMHNELARLRLENGQLREALGPPPPLDGFAAVPELTTCLARDAGGIS
jgi:hypothetical protein